MHKRYIAMSTDKYGGHWGAGATIDQATKALKKAGGNKKTEKLFLFTSELPFAPPDRPAELHEADCWVGRDGSISWVRCEREQIL